MIRMLYILVVLLAISLFIYNVTFFNFGAPFKGDSLISIIGMFAAICAVLLIVILVRSGRANKIVNDEHNV